MEGIKDRPSSRSVGRPFDKQPFAKTIVHLDLKGAPPIMEVYEWLFPLLKKLNVDGVLMEYEDMFPYSGSLMQVKRSDAYGVNDIARINELAAKNHLEIIPLVQTFGHMEFVLKHSAFFELRENIIADNTICPTDARSTIVIKNIIEQVEALHPNSKRIHIGADEALHIAEDRRCKVRLSAMDEADPNRAKEKLKLSHIASVARLAKSAGFEEVLAWNDMFDKSYVEDMLEFALGELITPVVWGYKVDVTSEGYFPDGLFERIAKVFPKIYFASAFKGAQWQGENYISVERYLKTQQSYVKLYRMFSKHLEGRVEGIILTGWQRYMHHAPLCELLAISMPSLITDLTYLENVDITIDDMREKVQRLLKCPAHMTARSSPIVVENFTYIPHEDAYLKVCDFEGKELFKLVMNDLHILEWKVDHFRTDHKMKHSLMMEVTELAERVKEELSKYYLSNDVNEFLNTKIFSLRLALT